MTRASIGEAVAKAILIGEHAVVHGVPAIAMPLHDCRLSVRFDYPPIGIPYEGAPAFSAFGAGSTPVANDLGLQMAMAAIEEAGLKDVRSIDVLSSIPIGAGLGSSAALAVGLVRATTLELDSAEVAARANRLEAIAHGTPSGIDVMTIATERPVIFEKGRSPEPLPFCRSMRLVVAVLPREGTTKSLVAKVRRLQEDGEPRFERFLDEQRELVSRALRGLRDPDASLADLGEALSAAHRSLATVGVSRPAQDALCEAMCAAGALGAKLSGAGGGGATLALLPPDDPDAEAAVVAAARAAGADPVLVT